MIKLSLLTTKKNYDDSHLDYVQTVDGIGRESVWYNDNTPNLPSLVNSVTSYLDIFKKAGKLVLVIDYVTEPILIDDFYSKAK